MTGQRPPRAFAAKAVDPTGTGVAVVNSISARTGAVACAGTGPMIAGVERVQSSSFGLPCWYETLKEATSPEIASMLAFG